MGIPQKATDKDTMQHSCSVPGGMCAKDFMFHRHTCSSMLFDALFMTAERDGTSLDAHQLMTSYGKCSMLIQWNLFMCIEK